VPHLKPGGHLLLEIGATQDLGLRYASPPADGLDVGPTLPRQQTAARGDGKTQGVKCSGTTSVASRRAQRVIF